MAIAVEAPEGVESLTEFVLFHDAVYAERPARWPALLPYQLAILTAESPFSEGRTLRPLVVREDGRIVARVVAMVDERYLARWGEKLGHLIWFEAERGARDATRALMDEACGWLRARGMEAARAGFSGLGEFPFVADEYETLPPFLLRQNPAHYHALLKDAGFEAEKGCVDYKIRITPELLSRWEGAVEAARRAAYELVPFSSVPDERRVADFTESWNEAFHDHWGASPFTAREVASLFQLQSFLGTLDTSFFAVRDGEAAGVVWVTPDPTALAQTSPGRALRDDERLNSLGIGVRAAHRGRGVNMALASRAFLEVAGRGATHVSYTLVLDDNWPSRRTAEKLGAYVCANYVVYRRNFRRTA